MTPEFFRVFTSTNHTEAFLKGNTAIDFIRTIQKNENFNQSQRFNLEFVYTLQNLMEREIDQVSFTGTPLLQTHLYDYMKSWVDYFNNGQYIIRNFESEIERHNEIEEKDFNLFVTSEEAKFKETDHYKTLNHLDFYEVDEGLFPALITGRFSMYQSGKKKSVQYNRFYEIKRIPDIILIEFLPKYVDILQPILDNYISISNRYIKLYEGGKLPINSPGFTEYRKQNEITETNKWDLLENTLPQKLKLNISVAQLCCLFRLFNDSGILGNIEATELFKFISNHFVTSLTEKNGISINSISNDFYTCDKKTITFWVDKFNEMNKAGRKL